MTKYIHLTKEQLTKLQNEEEVEILVGKKIKRTLTMRSAFEIEREKLTVQFETKIAKLQAKVG